VKQQPGNRNAHLTSGRLLARNALWNLVGNGSPILVAVFCIPVLIRGLGTDRFGVLTLTWAVIGYGSLFDLGLGRALTQLVARKLGAAEDHGVPTLVWTSLLLMLLLGLIGAAVVVLLAPWLVERVLHVPAGLQRETIRSFYLIGLSIPVVTSTAGLRGFLEAHQRFGWINALRVPTSVLTFVAPLLVLPFSKNLFSVVAALAVVRLIACAAHLLLCLRFAPELRQGIAWESGAVGALLRFGGWMTVSNVVGPLMVTVDRFLIAAVLSVGAVAYYATPYEVVTKFWIVPGAIIGVMFPAFSTSFVQDHARMAYLFRRSAKYLLLVLFPIVLLVVVLAQDGLRAWLGAEFAQRSTHVLQWLAIGVFINSLAMMPAALLQGAGRPDLTAKLHLIELPGYLLALWWLTKAYGIDGTAAAWTIRAAVDALVLFHLTKQFLPVALPSSLRPVLLMPVALMTLVLATLPQGHVFKGIFLLVTMIGFLLTVWLLLSPEERHLAQQCL